MNTDFLDVQGAPDVDAVLAQLSGLDLDGADIYALPADQAGLVELAVRHPDRDTQRAAAVSAFHVLKAHTDWSLLAIDGDNDRTLASRE